MIYNYLKQNIKLQIQLTNFMKPLKYVVCMYSDYFFIIIMINNKIAIYMRTKQKLNKKKTERFQNP